MAKKPEGENGTIPAYIPWETFVGFIDYLKQTSVTSRIDKSAMPTSMPALTRGQVISALKFLGLVNGTGTTQPSLRKLTAAYGTEEWKETLAETIFPAYDPITGSMDLAEATRDQLEDQFRAAGVSGQMLSKSVRFFLAFLTAAEATFSPHLMVRRKAGRKAARKKAVRPKKSEHKTQHDDDDADHAPKGMIDFPIPIGETRSFIRVPRDITTDQFPMVSAIVNAVEQLAKQNAAEE